MWPQDQLLRGFLKNFEGFFQAICGCLGFHCVTGKFSIFLADCGIAAKPPRSFLPLASLCSTCVFQTLAVSVIISIFSLPEAAYLTICCVILKIFNRPSSPAFHPHLLPTHTSNVKASNPLDLFSTQPSKTSSSTHFLLAFFITQNSPTLSVCEVFFYCSFKLSLSTCIYPLLQSSANSMHPPLSLNATVHSHSSNPHLQPVSPRCPLPYLRSI